MIVQGVTVRGSVSKIICTTPFMTKIYEIQNILEGRISSNGIRNTDIFLF